MSRRSALGSLFIWLAACAPQAVPPPPATTTSVPPPPPPIVAPAPAHATPTPKTLDGAHFQITWQPDAATSEEATRVLERAEAARDKLGVLLGKERVGEQHFRIKLAGDGSPRETPTVDPQTGEIILYRFLGEGGAYEASLAHELGHAIRRERWTKPDLQTDAGLFWEEGFAELAAREAGFPSRGFPLYGVDADVAAATFVARGEALPIRKLLVEHRALNFRCMAQAYVERISFMTFLASKVGLKPLIAIAYVDTPLDVPTIERLLGAKIDALAAEHEKILTATSKRAPARIAGAAYREKSPIRFLPVCPQ